MSQDMDLHISDSHMLCSVHILSSQHTQVYSLVGCQYNWAGMNTHPVHLLVYTDCLAHMVMDCKDYQAPFAQLDKFKDKRQKN
jgi:hypothetical protein